MSTSLFIWLTRWEVTLFVGGLAITIAIRLLTGEINTHFLLYGTRNDGTKYFSPERVQLLVATLTIACQYFLNASHTVAGKMPTLPTGSLELLGLSNAVYLGGKAWTSLKSKASA
jgi:hypothetical protein